MLTILNFKFPLSDKDFCELLFRPFNINDFIKRYVLMGETPAQIPYLESYYNIATASLKNNALNNTNQCCLEHELNAILSYIDRMEIVSDSDKGDIMNFVYNMFTTMEMANLEDINGHLYVYEWIIVLMLRLSSPWHYMYCAILDRIIKNAERYFPGFTDELYVLLNLQGINLRDYNYALNNNPYKNHPQNDWR